MRTRLISLGLVFFLLLIVGQSSMVSAQEDLVAILEVLSPGVQVKPSQTTAWITINQETLIRTGDSIRTDETGEARLTFFADGTATEITPDSEVTLSQFRGSSAQFTITLDVLGGVLQHQVNSLLDPASSYEVNTPGMSLTVRGTDFAVRVEADGRSALITSAGAVGAQKDTTQVEVPVGFGVRAPVGDALSDVVAATSFDELDSALDGCTGTVETSADVRLYVRNAPSREGTIIGAIDPAAISIFSGRTTDGLWYRIPFRGGLAWFDAALMTVTVDEGCPRLREFDDAEPEDLGQYESIDLNADAIVTVVGTNLRELPDRDSMSLAVLEVGDILTITGRIENGTWLAVLTEDRQVGWISTELLRTYIDLELVTVLEPEIPAADEAPDESENEPETPASDGD